MQHDVVRNASITYVYPAKHHGLRAVGSCSKRYRPALLHHDVETTVSVTMLHARLRYVHSVVVHATLPHLIMNEGLDMNQT